MGQFVRGDVVVVPFPFSGASDFKRRPALVLATWTYSAGTDCLLCMISSQQEADPYILELDPADIEGGSLTLRSYIRPSYMFASNENQILYRVGRLKSTVLTQAIDKILTLLGYQRRSQAQTPTTSAADSSAQK